MGAKRPPWATGKDTINTNAGRMMRQMEMDTQEEARKQGVSTDEESIRRAKEKRRK